MVGWDSRRKKGKNNMAEGIMSILVEEGTTKGGGKDKINGD